MDESNTHRQGSSCSSGLADSTHPGPSNALIQPGKATLLQPPPGQGGSSRGPLAALDTSVPNCNVKEGAEGVGETAALRSWFLFCFFFNPILVEETENAVM